MPVLQDIFLGATDARRLASRNIMAWHKTIAFQSRAAELLEVGQILNHDPLLLTCDGSADGFAHQVEHPLAVLVLARVDCRLMARQCCVGTQEARSGWGPESMSAADRLLCPGLAHMETGQAAQP